MKIKEVIYNTLNIMISKELIKFSITLRTRTEQNLYIAELAAIILIVRHLSSHLINRQITIFLNNQNAVLTVSKSKH